ncbi:amidohydrolase [Simiduia curdlanivorans]|uniref:Amidohydrolase n=1 Tax=Simiduia curdlanivorans TaxID=1492769 RepID=A0ABV8V272_9GAMM|nr:amidohydrolase [Simiduia curdlanivorans]MDN3640030.1 amidohydrolase [Simiduia curdlanivorans]
MKERLSVGLLQADLMWQSPEENRRLMTRLLDEEGLGLDLAILPEVFTTGFTNAAHELAEPAQGPTLDWMANLAGHRNITITGSYLVREGEHFYNRLIWMPPSGDYGVYDKRHLFSMAGEHRTFSAGKQRVVFGCNGWRCCPMICYDLRFPVWSRSRADYDLLFYVANWPEARVAQWSRLLPARAIENQAYVAGVNRVGIDGEGFVYVGDSQIFDSQGEPMAENVGGETIVRTELSAIKLAQQRDRFPVLDDADEFTLKL